MEFQRVGRGRPTWAKLHVPLTFACYRGAPTAHEVFCPKGICSKDASRKWAYSGAEKVRRKRLPFPQGQRQPDVNYISAISSALLAGGGSEFFYLSLMRPCGAADFTCGSCKTAWHPRSHRESPGCLGGRTPPRERRCSGTAGRDRRCRNRRGTPCRAGSSRIPE